MAWKDNYIATYGDRIGIEPSATSEPQGWKERYQAQLEERKKRQQEQADAAALLEEERAAREKQDADIYKKQQTLYDIAMDMQSTAYVSELDRKKRELAGNFQSYFDAEKRNFQYSQKAQGYYDKAQEIVSLLKSYPEDEYDSKDILKLLDEQSAYLEESSAKLADEAEYWKRFEDKDAFDLAMRQLDIDTRQLEMERQADVEKRNEEYAASGEAYVPGAELGFNEYFKQNINDRLREAAQDAEDPYARYTEAEDFEELSKLGAEIDNRRGIQNKVTYGRENADMLAASAFIGGSGKKESGYYRYQQMTDDQVNIYNYLLMKEGENAADEYLKTVENEIDKKLMSRFKQGTAEFASENPVVASAASVGAAPLAGAGYLSTGIQKLLGKEVDANEGVHGLSVFQNTVRGTVANNISEKYGDVAAFLYQTGMSIGDNALVMLSTGGSGWLGGALLGMNAAESTMLDAVRRGATDEQALLTGLWAGAAEMIFEKISIDNFVKLTKSGRGALIKNILKQAGIEGSEETFTEIADAIGDKLIMGDLSNYDLAKQKYLNDGQSDDEAKKNALLDIAKNVGLAAAGGAISGGVFGAGGSVIGALNRNTQSQTLADVENAEEDPLRLAAREMADQEAEERAQREAQARQAAMQERASQDAAMKMRKTAAEENRAKNEAVNAPESAEGPQYRFEPDKVVFRDGNEVPARYEMDDAGDVTVYLDENGPDETTITVKRGTTGYDEVTSAYQRGAEKTNRKGEYQHVRQEYSDEAYTAMDETARKRFTDSFAVMDAMATRAGLDIRIVDRIDVPKNGETMQSMGNARYNPDENVIDIALDAQDGAYEYVAAHELTHYIKSKNELEYGVLADVVTEALTKNGEDVDALVRAEMERNGYTEEIAREEVIANSIPAILNDEATVRRLVETNRSAAQRIADFIRQMIADIKAVGQKLKNRASWRQMGSLENDVQSLQEISDLFIGALESTAENNKKAGIANETTDFENKNDNTENEKTESTDDGVRFSIKDIEPDESADALIAENAKLREAVDLLRAEFELTKGNMVSKEDVRKIARQIKREYQSEVDYEKLADQLETLFEYLAKDENPDWTDVQRVGMAIGTQVIDRSRAVDKTNYEHYADVRKRLKTARITLNEAQKQEAAYIAGTYDGYRKRLFGAVGLVNEGTPLDTLWGELSEMNPELFPEDAPDVDMPGYLLDAAEHMRPQYTNPYEMDRREAANDVLMKAYQAYFESPKVRTFADKQKAKYNTQLERYRTMMAAYRDEVRQKYTQRLSAIRKEDVRKRQVLAKKISEEKSEQMKAALRKQYRGLTTNYHERLEQNRARYSKWKETDRAKERYIPRIERNARDMANWLMKPTDAKHVPEKLKGIVNDFLKTLDFAGEKTTLKANEWRERMRDLKDAMQDIERGDYDNISFFAELDPDFLPRLKDFMEETEGIRLVSAMDGAQLKELNYLLASIKRSVTYANKLYQNERFQTVAEVGDRAMEELNARKEAKQLGRNIEMVRNLLNVDQLDAFAYQDQLGAAGGTIIQELRDGLDVKVRDVVEAEEYVKKLIKKTDINALKTQKKIFSVQGGNVELSKVEIMSLYCLNKRRQGRWHIYGRGIKTKRISRPVTVSTADINSITATLSTNEIRIADGLQEYMSTEVSNWGNFVSMLLYGYRKFTEQFYFPIKSDENYVRSQDEDSMGGGYYRLKNLGMTKSTVKGARNPLILEDIFEVFTRHIDEMSSYHAFVVPLSDAMKFINYKTDAGSTKESITRALGTGGKKYFTTLIKDINGFKTETGSGIGEKMLRNAKIAAVGANVRVVMQQPTAYMRAMNMISPKYLMKAVLKPPSVAKSQKYCPIAKWKAYGFYDLDIGKGLYEILTGGTKVKDTIRNAALMPAQAADNITWGYLWNACEAETKAKHPELDVRSNAFNEAVGKRLSEIVDRTQVVDSVFHRSQIMRRKGFTQFFTTFMSEPTKTYNMVRTAAAAVTRNPQDTASWTKLVRATSTYALTGIFTAAAAALVDAVRDDEETDEEGNERDFGTKYGAAFGANTLDILSPLNMIPYLREIQSLAQGFKPNRLDMRGAEYLLYAATNWQKWFAGESTKSVYGLVYQTAQGLSYLTGVPASNAMRAFEGIFKMLTGQKLDKENETATAAKAYGSLYQAILKGDKATINRLKINLRNGTSKLKAKSNSDIDAGIAEQLMLNEQKIAEAYAAKLDGNPRTVLKIKNELINAGFSGEMVDKALLRYADVSTAEISEKDLDKELDVKLFSTDDMVTAIERAVKTGDISSLDLIYSELLADSTAKDPVTATKSNITGKIKPVYLGYYDKGDSQTMYAIENILIVKFGYKESEFNDWIKAYNKTKAGP